MDDEATPLSCRTLVLQSEGYSVLKACSAEEALKVFRENHVDLVMSDHLLGSVTGAQVATEMKHIKPDVRVIIYSGVVEIPEGGADLFLGKTEPVAIMLQQISDMLKRHNEPLVGMRDNMPNKTAKGESFKATLSRVTKEMNKPRTVKSAREVVYRFQGVRASQITA
jgi:DNA-binding NtrC family response regulator